MTLTDTRRAHARDRSTYLVGLVWHAGAFIIINGFMWLLDAAGGGGINWAYWITAAWGFALAFHALAYYVDGRQLRDRKMHEYFEEERQHESQIW